MSAPVSHCRFCGTAVTHTVVDLGMSPLCESFVPAERLNAMEPFYPLHAKVCAVCWLVQVDEYVGAHEIFTEYAYFSSFSESWLQHAHRYVDMITERLALTSSSRVVELASNDGYLLQWFVQKGIPALGIDPAVNVAEAARARGVPTLTILFGEQTAPAVVAEHGHADLVIGNNVLAQVPDLNGFVAGIRILLAPTGVATLEFPHLLRLLEGNQFDTIYHEHFGYFSLAVCERIAARHGLTVFDVEELTTHGGSLRLYLRHAADATKPVTDAVHALRALEQAEGLETLERYARFTAQVEETKRRILSFLIEARRAGKQVVGYGAPGKGNTLLNYCGIRTDFLAYTVDRNPYKHGRYTPGTHIPIHAPERIAETRPDYVFILPWNLRDEVVAQLAYIREWGGRCVVPIPTLEVLP